MKNKKHFLFLVLAGLLCLSSVQAQISYGTYDPTKKCVVDANGECIPNTILSAVPFLRIVPDARSGALGDAGLAISPDANAMHFNAAKLAFAEQDFEVSATYTPWLKNLGLNDVYLAYLSGYNKLDDLQAVGYSLRFFSLGEIDFRDEDGNPSGNGKPREFEISGAYSRKLGDRLSGGVSAKYIYSNLASGQQVGGIDIKTAHAFAADISVYHKSKVKMGNYDSQLTFGLSVSNLGSKVSYSESVDKDFIPANFGLGSALDINFDEYNSMTFTIDINKLLLPTPDTTNVKFDGSSINAAIASWLDAPGGITEELRELYFSTGVEYWYDKQFAVRAGYFYENPLKGDRQFLTVGVGLKYNVYGMNLSYLVPTNNRRNPLDNTLRFSLLFDFTSQK
jgi:hypothetical protein